MCRMSAGVNAKRRVAEKDHQDAFTRRKLAQLQAITLTEKWPIRSMSVIGI